MTARPAAVDAFAREVAALGWVSDLMVAGSLATAGRSGRPLNAGPPAGPAHAGSESIAEASTPRRSASAPAGSVSGFTTWYATRTS